MLHQEHVHNYFLAHCRKYPQGNFQYLVRVGGGGILQQQERSGGKGLTSNFLCGACINEYFVDQPLLDDSALGFLSTFSLFLFVLC